MNRDCWLRCAVLLPADRSIALTETAAPAADRVPALPRARRWPGELAGRFLYPGWPSGVLFVVLLVARS